MTSKQQGRTISRSVKRADSKLTKAAGKYRGSPAIKLLGKFGELGDQPELRTLSALVVIAGLLARQPRVLRAGVRMLIAHETATALKDLVKTNIDRTRPRSTSNGDAAAIKPGKRTSKEITSFPSGHSAGAMAVARAFSREFPEYAPPALLAAGTIAAVQVPRRAHYGSDVAAGLAVGFAAEALANAAGSAALAMFRDGEGPPQDSLPEGVVAAS